MALYYITPDYSAIQEYIRDYQRNKRRKCNIKFIIQFRDGEKEEREEQANYSSYLTRSAANRANIEASTEIVLTFRSLYITKLFYIKNAIINFRNTV